MSMSARRNKIALATLVVLVGCAGPRPKAPPDAKVEPPATWRTTPDHLGPELSATWWDAFDDPGLTRIVATALADNDDVKIAAARVEELMGQAAFARAQRMPEVDGAVVYQRDRSINPAFGIAQVGNATEPVVSFSFDADLFGRLRAADAAARANLLGTRAAQADVRLLVAATAARDWFTLRSLDSRLETLRQTLDAREQTLKLVRRRVSVGYAAQLDLAQAEAEYRATEQQIPATELAIRRTEDALSILLGRTPASIDRGDHATEPVLPPVPAAVPSSLLRRRPDIVEAEERIVAADRALDASRAAFMPDLRLSGDWGHVTSTILHNHPVDVFTVGASILAPIFDAGRLKAQENSAAARRDQAAFAYRKAALESFGQVEDALAATQRLHEQLDSLQAQKVALERTLQIATERYKSGYAPFLDQLDAQRSLLSVQLAIAQAQADQLNAYVTLFQALGGGWDRSLVDGNEQQASAR
jgi:outer membrane protein, multidrug efflux system